MSSYYPTVELKHPTAFRWVAYYFLWFAHLFDPLPILKPISVLVLVVTHLDVLSIPRKWSAEIILAMACGLYVVFLLFLHRTIFDVSLGELGLSSRIPYTLVIFLIFASIDSQLALERPMLRAGLGVGGALALVSLWYYFQNPDATFFETRQFEMGGTLTGLYQNHNAMASAMGAVMIGAFAWWLHSSTIHDPEASMPEMAFLPAIIAAFLLTKSRSFLAAAIVVGIYAGFLRRGTSFIVRFGTTVVLLAAMAGGIALVATRDQEKAGENVEFRLQLYREAVERIPMSPFIGLGIGSNSEAQRAL